MNNFGDFAPVGRDIAYLNNLSPGISSLRSDIPCRCRGGPFKIEKDSGDAALFFCYMSAYENEFSTPTYNKKVRNLAVSDFFNLAVRGGFEPPVQLPVRQFSKLVVSATHPSHQAVPNPTAEGLGLQIYELFIVLQYFRAFPYRPGCFSSCSNP